MKPLLNARRESPAELIALPRIKATGWTASSVVKKIKRKVAVCLVGPQQAVCIVSCYFYAVVTVAIRLIGLDDATAGEGVKFNTIGAVAVGSIGYQRAIDGLTKPYPNTTIAGGDVDNADVENKWTDITHDDAGNAKARDCAITHDGDIGDAGTGRAHPDPRTRVTDSTSQGVAVKVELYVTSLDFNGIATWDAGQIVSNVVLPWLCNNSRTTVDQRFVSASAAG